MRPINPRARRRQYDDARRRAQTADVTRVPRTVRRNRNAYNVLYRYIGAL